MTITPSPSDAVKNIVKQVIVIRQEKVGNSEQH